MNHIIGLVEGRHPLPVDTYIYDVIEDITDVQDIERRAYAFLSGYNKGDHVTLYITGLTVALVAVIKACQECGLTLTFMHFNQATGEGYYPQQVI